MKFVFVFPVFVLFGFALGSETFSEETIAAFNFAVGNEILTEKGDAFFNVMDHGAVGNGRLDDSQAFLKAWKVVCSAKVGGQIPTLVVPKGKTFLLSAVVFQGPCQAKTIHFQLGGTLIPPQGTSWANAKVDSWISFQSVDNLIINGGGKINGQGSNWWKPCKKATFGILFGCNQRPGGLSFRNCNGLRLKGLTHLDSPRRHISINGCKDVIVSNLLIKAPGDSPNTDGIDISHSSHVLIKDSNIKTGDDCVAINAGSSFINVVGVNCGPGHGFSIGSLGDGGPYDTVEEVHVKNCKLHNTQNGVRIKTIQGASGFARKISFEHIILNNVDNPIIIDQFYRDKGKIHSYGVLGKASAVKVSDVTYTDIRGSSASNRAINLKCDNAVGCRNIIMNHIHITSSAVAQKIYGFCNNARGTAVDVNPKVTCLSGRSGMV